MVNENPVEPGPVNARWLSEGKEVCWAPGRLPPDQTKLGSPIETPLNASEPVAVSVFGMPVCPGISAVALAAGPGGGGGSGGGAMNGTKKSEVLEPFRPASETCGGSAEVGGVKLMGTRGGSAGGGVLDPLEPLPAGPDGPNAKTRSAFAWSFS